MRSNLLSLSCFVLMLFAGTAPALAQGIHFGVKGGYNISQMTLGSEVLSTESRNGFFVGPVIKASLPVGIGLDVAGLYDERDVELGGVRVKMKSINVPVNLRFNIGLGSVVGAYMTIGPQFSFSLGEKDFDLSETYSTLKSLRLSDSCLSANMGAGIYLTRHVEIGAVYNIAIDKTGELEHYTINDALQTHASAWQIVASVYF